MFTPESTIRRDAEGRWFHDGELIDTEAIARAFDRWIDIAEDGRYILKNSVNWAYVEIEGAPLFVTALSIEPARVVATLSDGTEEELDAGTLRQDERGVLYCDARGGKMAASFTRAVQHQLEPLVGEEERGVYLELGGARRFPPVYRDPISRTV
jgi:hypothetical protein